MRKASRVTFNAAGDFTYDAPGLAALQALAAGETITDTFTYTIEDGNGNTDTATVTVTVTGVNDGPTAVNDVKTFDADKISAGNALTNDTDPDSSDVLTADPETGVTDYGATFIMTANGSYQYDPTTSTEIMALSSGTVTDSFEYTIHDGNGGTSTATVTITVNCVNDAPDTTDRYGNDRQQRHCQRKRAGQRQRRRYGRQPARQRLRRHQRAGRHCNCQQ